MMRVLTGLKSSVYFFNYPISYKYSNKCCRYNQNGQPLSLEKALQAKSFLEQFLYGWKLNQNASRLIKHYYSEDYPMVIDFLGQIITIDAHQFRQCPSFSMKNGQILKLQLYSITLKGLSMVDFQLAMRINNIKHQQYRLIELSDPQNYRKQIGKVRMKRQSQRVRQMLDEDTKNWNKTPNVQ